MKWNVILAVLNDSQKRRSLCMCILPVYEQNRPENNWPKQKLKPRIVRGRSPDVKWYAHVNALSPRTLNWNT